MGPPPFNFMRGVRGWVSISKKVSPEGLYGRVSLRGFVLGTIIIYIIGAVDMLSRAGGITICGGPPWRDSTTLDVATIQDTKIMITHNTGC